MVLFHPAFTPEAINAYGAASLPGHLGMECVDIGADFLRMRMPVDARTHQPQGLLHGGASVALGETIGGVASAAVLGPDSALMPVGLEINANHVRGARDGFVIATCRALHLGRTTHVWDIRVETAEGKLVSVIRLTNALVPRA
jgi:1,4-dihydroxy-2-naphthoyl-CoA hydrolase